MNPTMMVKCYMVMVELLSRPSSIYSTQQRNVMPKWTPYKPKKHRARNLLHKDQLMFFKHWVLLPAQGYIEMSPTGHPYEVLRIRKKCRQGDLPDIFFYLKLPPTQHVTCDKLGTMLVRKWLRSKKAPESEDLLDETFGERFEISEQLLNGQITLNQWYARMRDLGFSKEEAQDWLDKE